MSGTRKIPVNLTVPEFLEWCPDDGQRWQLLDGEPVAMAPAKVGHGALQAEVGARLRNHLLEQGRGCRVVTAPGVVPKVRAGFNFRIPDLGVTCAPIASNDVSLREPVLLMEILSVGNARDTWANVWAYTTIPSVREILVLHTASPRAELLRRDAEGNWPAEPLLMTEGRLALESIGFGVELAEVYRVAGGG
jgi:Uma2 family endonuclease